MMICPSANGIMMAITTRIVLFMASWFLAYKCLDTKYGVARYALLIVIRSMIQGVCMVGGLHDLGKRALVI